VSAGDESTLAGLGAERQVVVPLRQLDRFGPLRLSRRRLTGARFGGVALLFAGAALIQLA